ncbi:MAG: alanine racemase [Lachnospiraceae bacterium]|nr:alanine racemase [Lachnospiraceae bacterium]
MNQKMVKEMMARKETPAYVFDLDKLNTRLKWLKELLQGTAKLCYAMKANPFLIEPMGKQVDIFEVCSPGEFRICERAHIPMENIVLSGVNKEKRDIEYVVNTYKGKGKYTIESWNQLELLEACAKAKNIKIDVLIRVTSGNQFGMDEVDVCKIIENRNQYPALNFKGLQFYSGTQKKKIVKIEKELLYLDKLCRVLEKNYDFSVEELEYGPGFFVAYFENESDLYDDNLMKEFVKLLKQLQFRGEIILEMGRFVVADCGYYFSKIIDQKINHGQNYCIIDGGINHVNYYGQTMAMKIPKHIHVPYDHKKVIEEKQANQDWNICGSLCTVGDVLVKNMPLYDPQTGDVLIFENIGAYSITEGIYLFLSRNLPKVFFYSDKQGLQLVRESLTTDSINSVNGL